MNDDDLLLGADDVQLWKTGELPKPWFEDQKKALAARCQAQLEQFKMLLASADPTLAARLNQRL